MGTKLQDLKAKTAERKKSAYLKDRGWWGDLWSAKMLFVGGIYYVSVQYMESKCRAKQYTSHWQLTSIATSCLSLIATLSATPNLASHTWLGHIHGWRSAKPCPGTSTWGGIFIKTSKGSKLYQVISSNSCLTVPQNCRLHSTRSVSRQLPGHKNWSKRQAHSIDWLINHLFKGSLLAAFLWMSQVSRKKRPPQIQLYNGPGLRSHLDRGPQNTAAIKSWGPHCIVRKFWLELILGEWLWATKTFGGWSCRVVEGINLFVSCSLSLPSTHNFDRLCFADLSITASSMLLLVSCFGMLWFNRFGNKTQGSHSCDLCN